MKTMKQPVKTLKEEECMFNEINKIYISRKLYLLGDTIGFSTWIHLECC